MAEAPQIRVVDIPHEQLDPSPHNVNEMTEAEIKALREEIRLRGFVQPILVRPKESDREELRYEITDGEHRWRILGELGAETVPCVIDFSSDETAGDVRRLTMNRLRGQFVPIKLAYALADLADRKPEAELAKRLAMDRAELSDYLSLAGYLEPPEPHVPRGGGEDDGLVEVVVVGTQAQARQIEQRLEELTEDDETRVAATLARAARQYIG
jgi:ParB/RepB/Spo0J family partition protein